jgi:glycosyltransferase involved in cell wall biosynthesis
MRLVRVAVNVEQLLYRPPGGIGRYTAKLVTLLPQLFPDDSVLAFTARHPRAEIDAAWQATTGAGGATGAAGARPIRLPLPRAMLYEGWNTFGVPRLGWLAPELNGIDLVHAPSVAVPPRGRAPLIVTVHDVAPALFPQSFPRHGRWFHARGLAATARRADLVITVSHAAAAEIVAHSDISPDRLRVVPNGVDHIEASAQEIGAAAARHGLTGVPYILWVGTLEPRKNVATLVRAFAELLESGRAADHRLILAGPTGWLSNDLIPASLLARHGGHGGHGGPGGQGGPGGPDGSIRLVGQVGDSELRALYAGATLFALPSLHEGFGLPVLEAMAQGTPVVCSDIAALREVVGEAAAARLVPPDDVDGWAGALADLIDDGDARRRMGRAGRDRAAAFSWERTIRETRQVYAEAVGGAG